MGFKTKSVEYYRQDLYLEIRERCENETFDIRNFDIRRDKGQRELYRYLAHKFGINFKKFIKEDEMEYY